MSMTQNDQRRADASRHLLTSATRIATHAELESACVEMWEIAQRMGLRPFPMHYEIVPAEILYEFGAYGMPGRFSHWTHGKAYHQMKTSYDYGLSKIYELVINTNPCHAFLLDTNGFIQNKLIIAHVLGHSDYFANNAYYARTSRAMLDSVALSANRIKEYEFAHGRAAVEAIIDAVLSVAEYVTPDETSVKLRPVHDDNGRPEPVVRKMSTYENPYADVWKEKVDPLAPIADAPKGQPVHDMLLFLATHSNVLEDWQRDIVQIIRQEMLYFRPQMTTKVCNEGWACATGESLLATERGFVRFDQLCETIGNGRVAIGTPGETREIRDYHVERSVPTLKVRTRRGLTIEGSERHRILAADGTWKYLEEVRIGDRLATAVGANVWPREEVALTYDSAPASATLDDVAELAGVSVATVIRHEAGRTTRSDLAIGAALTTLNYREGAQSRVLPNRNTLHLPATLNEDLGWFLGYFIGNGCTMASGITIAAGDEEMAETLKRIMKTHLGVNARAFLDTGGGSTRWRIVGYSQELLLWLTSIGINLDHHAREKQVPEAILRSPKHVMAAFLRGYFDADGYAGSPGGIILSSASRVLIETVQTVLLNYGILSRQNPQAHEIINLCIRGRSAALFREEIGFSLTRKRDALAAYVDDRQWFKDEDVNEEVVSIESGVADVFDITVDDAHRYVANGFINHNSYWHTRIIREMRLTDDELISFAELHSGVLQPHPRHINPYYLGFKILEDIERRFSDDGKDMEAARAKLFEVRELENDASLIRNYLTEELVKDLDLYMYAREADTYWGERGNLVVKEKQWEKVREGLIAHLASNNRPTIVIDNGDYNGNRELFLRHVADAGRMLDLTYAEKVMQYLATLWGRTVHLETTEEKGAVVTYSYNPENKGFGKRGGSA